jgi:hypothetical protein
VIGSIGSSTLWLVVAVLEIVLAVFLTPVYDTTLDFDNQMYVGNNLNFAAGFVDLVGL